MFLYLRQLLKRLPSVPESMKALRDHIQEERIRAEKALADLGYTLSEYQPHISGERVLLSGKKLVLEATDTAGKRVVVKCSRYPSAIQEIKRERKIHRFINNLEHWGGNVRIPKEIAYTTAGDFIFFITEYIEQEKVFVEYPLRQQFFFITSAIESQETAQLTTYHHQRKARKACNVTNQRDYTKKIQRFLQNIEKQNLESEAFEILNAARAFMQGKENLIGKYCCTLMHDDFVPHNFRIHNNELYVLDYTSINFGNPYETWARLINYMVIHNPDLRDKLLTYITSNRTQEEYTCLRVMRIYKALFLLNYYTGVASSTEGDIQKLAHVRIRLWIHIIDNLLSDTELSQEYREAYIEKRNSLRSKEEKERQREFNDVQGY